MDDCLNDRENQRTESAERERTRAQSFGLAVLSWQDCQRLERDGQGIEPFGFSDGISQPGIRVAKRPVDEAFIGRIRDELVSSGYREGCAMAPVVIESTPASDHLSNATRRGFQDIIATLAARLTEGR